MTARILNEGEFREAARKRLAGVVVAVGVGFDLDAVDGHDVIADRVVAAVWRAASAVWVVEDVGLAWDRLRRSCGRVGGRSEMPTAWRLCHRRVAVLASMPEHRHLNAGLTVIEAIPLGSSSARHEAIELAASIGGHVIVVDPREAPQLRVERKPCAADRYGRNAEPVREKVAS